MPVMWLGTYQLLYGPNQVTFDQETTVAVKDILTMKQRSEPVGFTLQKLQMQGFLYSTSNQALIDISLFHALDRFKNRPVSVGFFTQDNSSSSSSQPWFSNVGYLTSIHFEYRGGIANYKYPFRFSFLEANPQVLIPCTDLGDHRTYAFSMTGQGNGYIAGVQLVGATIATSLSATQTISAILNNSSAVIGTGPALGSLANQLFSGNPLILGGASNYNVDWPLSDVSGNQSIQLTSPTGTYEVVFSQVFASPPSSVNVIYLPV